MCVLGSLGAFELLWGRLEGDVGAFRGCWGHVGEVGDVLWRCLGLLRHFGI